MFKVKILRNETSQPIIYEALNCYTKGPFYCVLTQEKVVHKYPLESLFRVEEQYS